MRDDNFVPSLQDGAHRWRPVASAGTLSVQIEPQPLHTALHEFAKQTGLQVLFPVDRSTTFQTSEIEGTLTPEEALQQLLAGSDLQFQFINSRTVAIHCASEARADERPAAKLEEVVVTAQKRAERLVDVPVSLNDREALAWLDRLADDSFEEDRGRAFVRWLKRALAPGTAALTLLLHTPHRSVSAKFLASQFRRLQLRFGRQASRVLRRHLLEKRNRRRQSRPAISFGFSQVQRQVV